MANHIRSLLAPFLQTKKTDWKVKLLNEWDTIMGPMAHNVTIIKIYDDTVILGVYDSSWLQELYLLSNIIIENINQKLDSARINQLRFKQIKRTGTPSSGKNSSAYQHDTTPITLTSIEQKALDRIDNESLRVVLKSFLVRCHREKKR